jgi:hypothetical protein
MIRDSLRRRTRAVEGRALDAEIDDEAVKALQDLPAWLTEFFLNISLCLERGPEWRNPTPSAFLTDECEMYLTIMNASHLSMLIEGNDCWTYEILVRVLRAAAERHLQVELGIDEDQAKHDLQLILKHRGWAFYLPDPQAWGRLSQPTQEYLTRMRPSTPRSP